MDKNKINRYLKFCMITGGIVDAIMDIIIFIPALRILIFGENPEFHTPQYQWAMGMLGSIGAAWTLLLFWASIKPFDRKDILLLTIFPLLIGTNIFTVYGFFTYAVSLQFLILFSIISIVHGPFFLYIWIKAKYHELK
jgi:hypothetical protein